MWFLSPDPKLAPLLEGLGLFRCGEVAALPREAVDVRLGAAGSALWRLARAHDPRPIFAAYPRERSTGAQKGR